MRLFNWAESFKETPTCEDILNKVQKTETVFWIWLLLSVIFLVLGITIVLVAPADSFKLHCIGLFLAIDGCINVALLKIWAHIRLAMYRILWDRENRIKAEMNKLDAEDL